MSVQLDNAHKAIKETGIKTKSFNICGTNEVDNTVLKITQSDDLEFGLCCCSIVPDKQNICDDPALKSFARALLPHIREFIEEQEEFSKDTYIIIYLLLLSLFLYIMLTKHIMVLEYSYG